MIGTLLIPAILALPGSVGVGIQAGPVCLPVTASPGTSYTLPPVTVMNTGSGGETIGLRVQNPGPGSLPGKPVPASWVKFGAPVKLASGAKGTVTAHLSVPSSARHGAYAGWVVAGPAGSATPGHAGFGAEAIAVFEFTVARPGHASRHVACVDPAAGHTQAAPPASPTFAGYSPKALPLAVFAGLVLAALYLIFSRRRTS